MHVRLHTDTHVSYKWIDSENLTTDDRRVNGTFKETQRMNSILKKYTVGGSLFFSSFVSAFQFVEKQKEKAKAKKLQRGEKIKEKNNKPIGSGKRGGVVEHAHTLEHQSVTNEKRASLFFLYLILHFLIFYFQRLF